MTGSIHTKNGYLYIVLSYKDTNGKHIEKWISTGLKEKGNKRSVKLMVPGMIEKYSYLETGEDPAEKLFAARIIAWHNSLRDKIEQTTWESYQIVLNAHILPYFSDKGYKVADITPKIISEYYNYLFMDGKKGCKGQGLAPSTIKKHASILRLFFNQMCIDGYIVYNPTLGVKTPRNVNYEKTKEVLLTKEEANNLLNIFVGTDLYLIIYMTLFYGLRRSEIIALKWRNFNFEKSTFEITDTIVLTKSIVSKSRTKTENSNMTYGILPELKQALIELKKEQTENKKLLGKSYQDNDLVFCKGDGTALRPDCLQRTFKRMLKRAGHPPMRFHDLRHSTASILYDCGWDLEKVKHWLRHSDIETTSNIYLKISKAREVLMANDLEGILKLKK